jgi:hypothetical protein
VLTLREELLLRGLLTLLRLEEELRLELIELLLRGALTLPRELEAPPLERIEGVLLPPPRLPPPPRCASTGVALRARPTITIAINLEVFMTLSFLYYCLSLSLFSDTKIQQNPEGISPTSAYFSRKPAITSLPTFYK